MSKKYPGGIISATPPVPAGPYETGAASGIWTLDQQAGYKQQGIWPTAGLAPNYIEDVFSTWLYTGNGSTQTITNGIDLAGKGGLVWIKDRTDTPYHVLTDTARGVNSQLYTNVTNAANSNTDGVKAFNSNGFGIGNWTFVNTASDNLVSWTFRKQPKFFDVVTYTGNGTATNNISHNLGSVPGFIVVKCTSAAGYRWVCAASDNSGNYLYLTLNTTFASDASTVKSNIATSTTFNPGYMGVYFDGGANVSGETYVAYLFASNAGGFGLTGTDNVISCGSFTASAGTGTINLGYEPQWVLLKRTDTAQAWYLVDVMRGQPVTTASGQYLSPNSSAAEATGGFIYPTATGFQLDPNAFGSGNNGTYIYIAIRRGPMKVPTDATKVFSPQTYTEITTNPTTLTTGWPQDLFLIARRTSPSNSGFHWTDRLRGSTQSANNLLTSFDTSAEINYGSTPPAFDSSTGARITFLWNNTSGAQDITYQFRRAPSFFDEVCYTGDGTSVSHNHNLGVAPQLFIQKVRNSAAAGWFVYVTALNGYVALNRTDALVSDSTPSVTSTTFITNPYYDGAGRDVVTYLFATCAGVSKVGNYTGTGATQTINCGFAAGSRFVMIKRTDSTGDWYVWDTARGMVSGTDPSLLFNSTAAEVNANSIYTATTGFQIVSTAAGINASGGSYIFLAIA